MGGDDKAVVQKPREEKPEALEGLANTFMVYLAEGAATPKPEALEGLANTFMAYVAEGAIAPRVLPCRGRHRAEDATIPRVPLRRGCCHARGVFAPGALPDARADVPAADLDPAPLLRRGGPPGGGPMTGLVTVATVDVLPRRLEELGVALVLGSDLAGTEVSRAPVLLPEPRQATDTEKLAGDFPEVFAACVVGRAQAKTGDPAPRREKPEALEGLANTFMAHLAPGNPSLGREALTEARAADPDLVPPREQGYQVW